MEDRLRRLEGKVDALSAALADLGARVRALEKGGRAATVDAPPRAANGASPERGNAATVVGAAAPPGEEEPAPPWSFSLSTMLTLVGRSFLVLGGAFLLRTITDAGLVPRELGILLGLVYAAVWIGLAARVGRGNPASSGFHALAAVVIAYPLVCEAATSFHALTPTAAMLLLVALTALGLGIAALRDLPAVGWLFSFGAIAAGSSCSSPPAGWRRSPHSFWAWAKRRSGSAGCAERGVRDGSPRPSSTSRCCGACRW
jgi:hypothetical protein